MKSIAILGVLFLSGLFFQVVAQDTTSTGKNWRLFPAKQEHKMDTSKLMKPQQLDFSRPDGAVTVHQDTRIDAIGSQLKSEPYFYGYTLQLEVSQQKSNIKEARYKILKIKPDIELDDPYEAPNIYLYAGRFYDRVSAYQFKNEIAKYFPNAIVVGPKKMDLPRIPEPEIPEIDTDTLANPNGLEGGMGQ
ncbi:hypothetical protein [Parvicella tangerina]|uniref:SPOR domain-containing protein n=1 Tax=Parvicella tangerina TaxID=2829795 RepID=A0A916JQJ1_9FLAO|nr:hypothetical protein [Parvicella tangerina]CAG5086356.1 hypothetical protein CRYO30217_03093 [Parvicella tangerina]